MGTLPPEHHWRLQCGHHCPPEGGPAAKPSGRRNQQKRPQAPRASASPASKTSTLWSVMNVPSGAALAHADGGAMTAFLDLGEEDDDEPFHEFNEHRMEQCGVGGEPSEPCEGFSHAH